MYIYIYMLYKLYVYTLYNIYIYIYIYIYTCANKWFLGSNLFTLLKLCVSSLRGGHANPLCIVPMLTDDPRRESLKALVVLVRLCSGSL